MFITFIDCLFHNFEAILSLKLHNYVDIIPFHLEISSYPILNVAKRLKCCFNWRLICHIMTDWLLLESLLLCSSRLPRAVLQKICNLEPQLHNSDERTHKGLLHSYLKWETWRDTLVRTKVRESKDKNTKMSLNEAPWVQTEEDKSSFSFPADS